MNVRDSEAVEAMLLAAGHEKAAGEADAELVIVNSCTVRQKAENKAIGKIGYLLSQKANRTASGAARNGDSKRTTASGPTAVGLMGCAVARLGKEAVLKKFPTIDFAVKPGELDQIPYVAKGVDPLAAHSTSNLQPSTFSAFVTVMTGCDNCCSYCIVPKVRGHEYSRPMSDIVEECRCLAQRGVKEITLLGQSVLKWTEEARGKGEEVRTFPMLLRELQRIDGLERIRFTSAHPKGCTDELIAAYRDCDKVCRHLHLPVQSGSDRVLKEMGRRYTREEYLAAVKKLREFDPEFSITTDVIVGYPGETEEDFELTRSLMEEAGFDNAFIFKYSPRPGTRSAALTDDVPVEEKERRDQVLLADQESRGIKRNQALVGTIREVMVEGPSKRNAARLSGRDSGNRIVVWDRGSEEGRGKREELRKGDVVKIRIVEAHPQILIGETP